MNTVKNDNNRKSEVGTMIRRLGSLNQSAYGPFSRGAAVKVKCGYHVGVNHAVIDSRLTV